MVSSLRNRSQGGGDRGGLDVLLVCSAGGHLSQLFLLSDAWCDLWVTLDREDARSLRSEETVF